MVLWRRHPTRSLSCPYSGEYAYDDHVMITMASSSACLQNVRY